MSNLPTPPPEDLSEDFVTDGTPFKSPETETFEYQTKSERQKIWLRWAAAGAGLIAAFWLLCMFHRFLCALLHGAQEMGHANKSMSFDWHWVFLGSIMVIPATAIILVFCKYAFAEEKGDSPNLKDLPLAQLLEALIDGIKGLFKK